VNTFEANQKLHIMATVTERPFPCGDNEFIDSVLQDHLKTNTEHDEMVAAHSGEENPAPFVFTYSQHEIPSDCNAYFVKITFDPTSTSNTDINVSFEEWPDNAGKPVSKSGEVYFSIVFFSGMRNRKGATYLHIRKAIESTDEGNYVGVVVRGYNLGGLVYTGDLTSEFPLHKDEL
jgi:hypothetical protein